MNSEIESFKTSKKCKGKPPKEATTPGFPGTTLKKNIEEDNPIDLDAYRSLVGKVMYYMMKIGPDCANAAREVSQFMSNPSNEHWRAMERLIGYLRHKGEHYLVMRKPKDLRPVGSADANYATNPDDRRSIASAIHTIGGTLINWTSRKQGSVTLSSTEAEYVSISSHCQETIFIQSLLDEISTSTKPAIIYEDNMGCIYLTKNYQVGTRTKHIDVRHHYIRDHIENGSVEVRFVRSDNNESDICTKNLPEKFFMKHAINLMNGTLRYWLREDVVNEIHSREPIFTSDRDIDRTDNFSMRAVRRLEAQDKLDKNVQQGTYRDGPNYDKENWTVVTRRSKKRKNQIQGNKREAGKKKEAYDQTTRLKWEP